VPIQRLQSARSIIVDLRTVGADSGDLIKAGERRLPLLLFKAPALPH